MKKERSNSLKNMIFGSTVFTMMALLLLFGIMMYAEYRTLESMSSTIEEIEVLADYYEMAGALGLYRRGGTPHGRKSGCVPLKRGAEL